MDEAGIDHREEYPYGYCEIGQRFHALKSGQRNERVSGMAAPQAGKDLCPNYFFRLLQHRFIREVIRASLLPQLQPADVIVIDHASFHRCQPIDEMVAAAGCEWWYLPPDSRLPKPN